MLKEQTQHQLGHPGLPLSGLLSQRCVAPTDARLNRARLAALLFRSPITGHDVWGVLGVWLDPKMNWKEHTKITAGKGIATFDALL